MRHLSAVAFLCAILPAIVTTADAKSASTGYCGPIVDTRALVQSYSVKHNVASDVYATAVVRDYGELLFSIPKGPGAIYYRKVSARWHEVGFQGGAQAGSEIYPKSWPRSVAASLHTELRGGSCKNPHFVQRGSV